MSERPPAGWDAQAADGAGSADPRRRARRASPARGAPTGTLARALATSIVTRVDETAPERRWRLVRGHLAAEDRRCGEWPDTRPAGGAALRRRRRRPGTGGPPTPSPATWHASRARRPPASTWDPTVRALTPPELLRVLATSPAPGTVLIVDDQIVPFLVSVRASRSTARRASSGTTRACASRHRPAGTCHTRSTRRSATTSIMGPLALQVGSGPNLVFLGAVVSNGLRMAFTARRTSLQRSAMGGLFVIPAWIHRTGPRPLPDERWDPGARCPPRSWACPRPTSRRLRWRSYLSDTDPRIAAVRGRPRPDVVHASRATRTALLVVPGRRTGRPATASSSSVTGPATARSWPGSSRCFIPSDEAIGPTPEPTVEPTVGPSPSTAGGIVMSVDELIRRVLDGSARAGLDRRRVDPVQAVSERWAPGAVHSCPQLCPMWHLFAGTRSIDVVVSMQAPAPQSIVGVQAFLVLDDGSVRALGPVATGPTGGPLDGCGASVPIADGLSVVHGWLRLGPPLLCPQRPAPLETGILGEPLSWSQCPGTWILPFAGRSVGGSPDSAARRRRPGSGSPSATSPCPPGRSMSRTARSGAGSRPRGALARSRGGDERLPAVGPLPCGREPRSLRSPESPGTSSSGRSSPPAEPGRRSVPEPSAPAVPVAGRPEPGSAGRRHQERHVPDRQHPHHRCDNRPGPPRRPVPADRATVGGKIGAHPGPLGLRSELSVRATRPGPRPGPRRRRPRLRRSGHARARWRRLCDARPHRSRGPDTSSMAGSIDRRSTLRCLRTDGVRGAQRSEPSTARNSRSNATGVDPRVLRRPVHGHAAVRDTRPPDRSALRPAGTCRAAGRRRGSSSSVTSPACGHAGARCLRGARGYPSWELVGQVVVPGELTLRGPVRLRRIGAPHRRRRRRRSRPRP